MTAGIYTGANRWSSAAISYLYFELWLDTEFENKLLGFNELVWWHIKQTQMNEYLRFEVEVWLLSKEDIIHVAEYILLYLWVSEYVD